MRRFSKVSWPLLAAVSIFAALVLFFARQGTLRRGSAESPTAPTQIEPVSNSSPSPVFSETRQVRPANRHKISSVDLDQRWKEFQDDYGSSLHATFTADHRIANIRNGDTPAQGVADFASGDKDVAFRRAQTILEAAKDLVGLNSAFPLSARAVRSDELSSQVEWVQTYDGVPVEPYGRVTIQLDAHGGLRGLYSNYISDPVVANEAVLSRDSARQSAFSQIAFQSARPDQVGLGELVLFAAGPQTSSAEVPLRYAYRFMIDGREVILDASDGKILSQRDRRVF